MKKKFKVGKIVVALLALIWLAIAGAPFYFMVASAFKEQFEIFTSGVFAMPKGLYLQNFNKVIEGDFYKYLFNSIFVVGVSLVLILFTSLFASYPFSRFKFKLNKPLFGIIVAAMAVPIHVTLIPVFQLTQKMNLYDTVFALIGPYTAFNLPISVFILTGFMAQIPKELEESAEIDGCGKYRTFFSIIAPLSKPGLATLAIYNSVNMWNEFSFALVLTQSQKSRTLPLSIWEYQGQYNANIPMIMAVLTLCALPMILAFAIGQDKLIKGMMAGAVKG
ncbi:binding-protein-dependent transport systems inner membrane component [Ruminiclostridium papyrosolvens DSM 2782]|uniref:Binding-protein-dependent transport systems inner membrane component n=1 Tax=Ruminiclostridium papyrosolvens DSM 2782 TaxID=588581 RepID=F1T7L9_9FIRM|nr:carbohydrate ABC transporter permease [Ruminiclostridium papyrosolvens]EGD49467.1 binding-protein-dependent transport systems inner membrane component [Ruminiclostridium papyrosolvens DSM 2782]WES33408.1 carbohydrate ABC transporter permease [Ruminiclostridium papyrosolvens DSM 2782]